MDLQLSGKTALITGASQGLGFATARLLAAEGARIAINSRSETSLRQAADEIRRTSSAEVLVLPGDLADPAVPLRLVAQTVERFDGLDILIVNAGGPPSGSFESFDEQAWQQAFNLTLMSAVRLIKAALPALRRSTAPSVLTVTSNSVKQPIPNLVLSTSLRSAVIGLTKSLALELGSDGIRFNSILPAWTETRRVREIMAERARVNRTTPEVETQKQAHESPLGRMGTPEEFANAAVFLVSPAASFITGVMLLVDGGMTKSTL